MSHARKTIRSAIAAILNTAPSAWSSVTETRIQSSRQIWPYLMVFAESETANAADLSFPEVYERSVMISIVGLLRLPGSGDTQIIEDRMDTMAAEIETKLTTTTLRARVAKVGSAYLMASNMDVILEDNGVDHAQLHQSWKISYVTIGGLPEAFS